MHKRRLRAPSPALVISLIALFVALGGTTYAATSLPRNSVGTKQLKKGAVTKAKINKKTLTQLKGNQGPQGPQGPHGPQGPKGDTGAQGVPGSARAYGQVVINGSGNYALAPGTTKGVVGLTQGGGGNSAACIQLVSSIDASTATVIATPNRRSGSSNDDNTTAFEAYPLAFCSGTNDVEVVTSLVNAPGGNVKSAFSFMVP